jgi:hypothetical protein
MRKVRGALLAVGLGLVGLFVTACGGGAGLLSSDQANTLNDQLNQVSSAYSSGRCNDVRTAVRGLADAVAALPASVKPALRQDLDYTANQVVSLAVSQCRPAAAAPPTTAPTTSTTTTTTPPTTTTTQTQPTHTATNPAPTTPATTPTTPGSNPGPSGGSGLPGSSGGTGGSAAGSSGGTGASGNGNGNGSNG